MASLPTYTTPSTFQTIQQFVPACAHWLRSFFRSLLRKSVLVGRHTVYWLSSRSTTTMSLPKIPCEIEQFESPIHQRFLALYYSYDDISPITEEEIRIDTEEEEKTNKDTHRTYLNWWIYVPMTYVHATTLFPVSLFGWTLSYLSYINHNHTPTTISHNTTPPTQPQPRPRLFSEEKYNANVDPLFYDRIELKRILMRPKNELEQSWLSRKLYVTTPRGNIMMHYDAFKEGFAYYGDQTGVPYRILNAMAMKYVMMFRCLDFFVDEGILPGNPSPLIDLLFQEETCEQSKKKHTMKHLLSSGKEGDDRNPFVKSRNNTTTTPGNQLDVAQAVLPGGTMKKNIAIPSLSPPLRKNKFLYMGKLQNASWLQSAPKRIYYSVSASSVYEDVLREANVVQRELMNYKTYKEQHTSYKKFIEKSEETDASTTTIFPRKF